MVSLPCLIIILFWLFKATSFNSYTIWIEEIYFYICMLAADCELESHFVKVVLMSLSPIQQSNERTEVNKDWHGHIF